MCRYLIRPPAAKENYMSIDLVKIIGDLISLGIGMIPAVFS